jgi:hypothetical protein
LGRRIQFQGVDTKVKGNAWHTLRVDFAGNHFKVSFDGKLVLEAKADSVTLFDDFSCGSK